MYKITNGLKIYFCVLTLFMKGYFIMRILLLLLFTLLGLSVINAAPIYKTKAGIAINGYDPIGYFEQSKPVKGSGSHAMVHDGATWLFSSSENLEKFRDDPDRLQAEVWRSLCVCDVS